MTTKIIKIIRKFTIEQWSIIDKEYIKFKSDLKCIGSIILIIFLIVIQRYYGQPRFFTNIFGDLLANFPLPTIWSRLYTTFACSILYLIAPYIYIRLIFNERLKDFGWTLKGIAKYKWLYIAIILVVLPLVVLVSFSKSFSEHYPLYQDAGNSLLSLILWELSYGLYFVIIEFFFRGFMVFSLAKYIGSLSIFVMDIPYVMIHFGKPTAETIGSIIAGITLGTLSLRTRSIFGGIIIHITIAYGMDIMALIQKGQLMQIFTRWI
ncbi:MAG: type II CAAX prenyl endopeptidase Rce1 family protein [Candidatus Poribacteria bacterium]